VRRRVALFVCASFALASGARAQSVEAFDATFRDWMQEHGVVRGILGVAYRSRLVFERGYGGQDPAERVLLASLSKAITGRCVAVLAGDDRLRLGSRTGDVLAPFFKAHGEPADPRIKDATVEQLLVHRAGFPPAPRDLVTPAAVDLLQKTRSPATATTAELLSATLSAPLASAPGEAFRYANVGYLVLGAMIETVTGESYERFCGREVLQWAGVKAPALDRDWRAFSSFGGWRLSGAEYLAFLARDRIDDVLWARPRDQAHAGHLAQLLNLLLDPHRRHAATGAPQAWSPAWYALGQFAAAPGTTSRIAWHGGSFGIAPKTIGMQAAQLESGAAWFAWYSPRPGMDATNALLTRLAMLPATIVDWPALDLFPERGPGQPARK
jgi:CubicO group peptidase (beta-lactamase class C family)